jgi:outer membrane protein TolC
MFSLILLHLYPALKPSAVKPVLKAVQKLPAKKIIHKDAFLEKAVKGFMSHNHEIISIQHSLTATMYEYNQARGKILPQLALVGGLSNQQSLSARNQFGGYQNTSDTSLNYGVQANYNLFDGFSGINGLRAKDFEVQSKLYEGLGKVSKKLLDFIKLILNIQESELKLEIGKRDVERKQKMYKEAKNRVLAGAAGKQDEFQASAILNEAIGRKGDAETDLKNTKAQFLEWTGVTYEQMAWLVIPEELLTNFDQLEATLHKTNTSILQAQAAMRAQEKNQKATNGRLFAPKFGLEFTASNKIGRNSAVDTETNAHVMPLQPKNTQTELATNLKCTVPLWSGGSNKSEALQASKAVAAAKHGFYSAAQQAKIDFQTTKESFVAAQDDHKLYASIAEDYQKSYDIALDKYQSGATSFTELQDIANRLYHAEDLLIRKDKERRKTAWELTQILGSLTPSKLCASLDKNFDPFSDYNKIKSRI